MLNGAQAGALVPHEFLRWRLHSLPREDVRLYKDSTSTDRKVRLGKKDDDDVCTSIVKATHARGRPPMLKKRSQMNFCDSGAGSKSFHPSGKKSTGVVNWS